MRDVLLDITFAGELIEWRGPAPFYFVAVPEEEVGAVREAARASTYGWGVVPVVANVREVEFGTSLIPRDGGYLLPLKVRVRREAGLVLGDVTIVGMRVEMPALKHERRS